MKEKKALTRRSFVAASAGVTAAVAATGILASAGAFAEEEEGLKGGQATQIKSVQVTSTLCNACPNQCGLRLFSQEGKYWKVLGEPNHPTSQGHLCTRGYGYPKGQYSKNRLQKPLKRTGDKTFTEVSWDDALADIGKHVKDAAGKKPESIFMIQDTRSSKQLYGKRFISALGSPNYYTDSASSNLSLLGASLGLIGTALNPDFVNSKYIVLIGKGYGDTFRPEEPHELMEAKAKGAKIVAIDPRLNDTSSIVDLWVPVQAGTELAFLLGVAAYLVKHKLYNAAFVAQHGSGFDEFAASLKPYTFEWVAQQTGLTYELSHKLVTEVAEGLGKNAPAALIENTWNGVYGAAYANTADTVRMVVLLNAMIGNFNEPGGEFILKQPELKEFGGKVKEVAKPQAQQYGSQEFGLTGFLGGSCLSAIKAAEDGTAQVMFFHGCNAVKDLTNSSVARDALTKVPFKVSIGVVKDDTAELCDYILPETSYLERYDVVQSFGGFKPCVAMRRPAVDKIFEETRSFDEIYTALAKASGVGEYFDFSLEEFNKARLEGTGLKYEELLSNGAIYGLDNGATPGKVGPFWTPSQKIEFASTSFKKAGLTELPTWVAPKLAPKYELAENANVTNDIQSMLYDVATRQPAPAEASEQSSFASEETRKLGQFSAWGGHVVPVELRLITGEQPMHNHTATMLSPYLENVSETYHLDRVWINKHTAAHFKINDGDKVELTSAHGTTTGRAYVTTSIEPLSVYVPLHYATDAEGLKSPEFGMDPSLHRSFEAEPGTGGAMFNEAIVTIKKVGA